MMAGVWKLRRNWVVGVAWNVGRNGIVVGGDATPQNLEVSRVYANTARDPVA